MHGALGKSLMEEMAICDKAFARMQEDHRVEFHKFQKPFSIVNDFADHYRPPKDPYKGGALHPGVISKALPNYPLSKFDKYFIASLAQQFSYSKSKNDLTLSEKQFNLLMKMYDRVVKYLHAVDHAMAKHESKMGEAEDWKDKVVKNPKTGNMVKVKSLPPAEQSKFKPKPAKKSAAPATTSSGKTIHSDHSQGYAAAHSDFGHRDHIDAADYHSKAGDKAYSKYKKAKQSGDDKSADKHKSDFEYHTGAGGYHRAHINKIAYNRHVGDEAAKPWADTADEISREKKSKG